jgi:hypothetical protein
MTPDGLNWEDVTSSHISRIAFQPSEASIFVEFSNGDTWKYPGDAEDWQAFRNAESKGRYVHYFLRGKGQRIG